MCFHLSFLVIHFVVKIIFSKNHFSISVIHIHKPTTTPLPFPSPPSRYTSKGGVQFSLFRRYILACTATRYWNLQKTLRCPQYTNLTAIFSTQYQQAPSKRTPSFWHQPNRTLIRGASACIKNHHLQP